MTDAEISTNLNSEGIIKQEAQLLLW